MGRSGYIIVTVRFSQEEGQWVGQCPELGTATCGDTWEEAKEAIEEAIELKVDTLSGLGELPRFLAEHGIPLYVRKPTRRRDMAEVPLDPNVYTQKRLVAVTS